MMVSGPELKRRREARGWSQAELGRHASVSQPTIAALEAGDQLSTRKLPQIAAALGVEPGILDSDYAAATRRKPSAALTIEAARLERLLAALLEALGHPDTEARVAAEAATTALCKLEEPLSPEPADDRTRLLSRLLVGMISDSVHA